jgi:hypothetical protein
MSIKKPKQAQQKNSQDLSALLEIHPQQADDRTTAIDPQMLKEAKKSAAAAHRAAKNFTRKYREKPFRRFFKIFCDSNPDRCFCHVYCLMFYKRSQRHCRANPTSIV